MNRFFMGVLSLSLSGTLTAIAIMCIHPVTKRFFSKKWNYRIWSLVAIRLMLPLSLGLTLFEIGSVEGRDVWEQGTVRTEIGSPAQGTKAAQGSRAAQSSRAAQGSKPRSDADQDAAAALRQEPARRQGVFGAPGWSAVPYIWLAGVLAAIAFRLLQYRRSMALIQKGSMPVADPDILFQVRDRCARLDLTEIPRIFYSDVVCGPVTVGLLHPAVILPHKETDPQQMQLILHHELVHVAGKDLWYKWGYQLLLCIHWFNPLLYVVGRMIGSDCELACDEAVLGQLTAAGRQMYGNVLLDAAENSISQERRAFSIMLFDQKKDLKERLRSICRYRQRTRVQILLSVCAFMAAVLFTACSNVRVSGGDPGLPAGEDLGADTGYSSFMERFGIGYPGEGFLSGVSDPDPSGDAWKVYDDGGLLAGEDVQDMWCAYDYHGPDEIRSSRFVLYGSDSILIAYVPEDMDVRIGTSFGLVKGRFKIVHILPDGRIDTINETGESEWQTVTMEKGRNVIKMVGQGAKVRALHIDCRDIGKKGLEKVYSSEEQEYADQIPDRIANGEELDKEKIVDSLYLLEDREVSDLLQVLLEQGIALDDDELCDFFIYSDSALSSQYLSEALQDGRIGPLDGKTVSELMPYLEGGCGSKLLQALPAEQFYEVFEETVYYLDRSEQEECLIHYLEEGGTLTAAQLAKIAPYLDDRTLDALPPLSPLPPLPPIH